MISLLPDVLVCGLCSVGSGIQISVTELKAALEGTSYDVTDEDAEWILDILDTNHNGKVSYEQFLVCKIHMRAQEVNRRDSIPTPCG